jgi:hypothetical protein
METLKHLLGICGEPHPNIYTIILLIIITASILKYKKSKVK